MLKLEEAWDYDDYINSALHEQYKTAQNDILKKTFLTENVKNELSKVSTLTNIFIFGEISCPDCRAVIPILEKMKRENENINLYIFPRKGNEKFLSLNTKASRIPSVMVEDLGKEDVINEGLVLIFEEFPLSIKSNLDEKSVEENKIMINSFRNGELSEAIQTEIINKILEVVKKR